MNISEATTRTNEELFYKRGDKNDARLGEIVPRNEYENADIVILGCPQDEGVKRNQGRAGAALAPDEIRREFYKLTPFGITKKICDVGNTNIQNSLEATHDAHSEIVSQILKDGKILVVLGGVVLGARVPAHFIRTHPLAALAKTSCDEAGHPTLGRVGVACGACWEHTIRQDEAVRDA